MKKKALFITFCLAATIVFAAEAQKEAKKDVVTPERGESVRSPLPSRGRPSADRQARYEKMRQRRVEIHQAAIAELAAIKKIAEEEGAVRTVAALDDMIAKKNAEFQKASERFEKQGNARGVRPESGGRPPQRRPAPKGDAPTE